MLNVVCGAPCAGKSTYVKANAGKADLIIDTDAIAFALGSGVSHGADGVIWKAALKARQALIDFAVSSDKTAWLIETSPSDEALARYQNANAKIVYLDPGIKTCQERAKSRPPGTVEAINRWYETSIVNLQKIGVAAVKAADGKGCDPVKSVAEKGSNMQRTDITEIFPDATKEQLDALMKLNGEDINNAKGNLSTLQTELKKAQEALAVAAAGDKSAELQDTLGKLQAAQTELETMKAANALRETREKVAAAKGIPISLLTGDTEEACTAQADAILKFAAQNDAFALKDGGEPLGKGGTPTREQFANWAKENNI